MWFFLVKIWKIFIYSQSAMKHIPKHAIFLVIIIFFLVRTIKTLNTAFQKKTCLFIEIILNFFYLYLLLRKFRTSFFDRSWLLGSIRKSIKVWKKVFRHEKRFYATSWYCIPDICENNKFNGKCREKLFFIIFGKFSHNIGFRWSWFRILRLPFLPEYGFSGLFRKYLINRECSEGIIFFLVGTINITKDFRGHWFQILRFYASSRYWSSSG